MVSSDWKGNALDFFSRIFYAMPFYEPLMGPASRSDKYWLLIDYIVIE